MMEFIDDMLIPFPFYHIQPVGGIMSFFHSALIGLGGKGPMATWSRYTTFICLN